MLERGLRVFVGFMIFISIFFYPLSLFAPANALLFDLQLQQQPPSPNLPASVQPGARSKTELPGVDGLPPSTSLQGQADPGPFLQQTPTTAAANPTESPPESKNALENDSREEDFAVETPPAIYRLAVPDKVALTFDDGPCPTMTEKYLAVLQAHELQATFFVVGQQASFYPEITEQIIAQGSELGSHSWKHDQMDKLTPKQITADLQKTTAWIQKQGGREVTLFRPPYGRGSPDLLAAAKELGQTLIYWDVDPRDWEKPSPQEIVRRVMEQVRPGSIIILHEGHQNTLTALPEIIQGLQARGLQPVSVSALLQAWRDTVSTDIAPAAEQE